MAGENAFDPRLGAVPTQERDVRPVVALPRRGLSGTALVIIAVAAGLLLFGILEARRRPSSAPSITRSATSPLSAAPPPLYIPPLPLERPTAIIEPPSEPSPPPVVSVTPPQSSPPDAYIPQAPIALSPPPAPPRATGGSALVIDASSPGSPQARPSPNDPNAASPIPTGSTDRARGGRFANRSTTVPQGTLIPAVLETAFDSTRPGFARALVQHDIRGFDGTQILIPRGSRLIGEYAADAARGQKRAKIIWSRLIRPDGVTITIDSPAADPVGRGGVKAKVNSHFLSRFAGAILQSTLDAGVNLAARAGNAPVVVAVPGSVSGATSPVIQQPDYAPTLTVAAGKSISIFVARDLDFTEVGSGR